jgi:hypothetical protein
MRFTYPARYDHYLNTRMTYREHLEATRFEKLVTPAFDSHARQIIASDEELATRGVRAVEASSERVSNAIGRQTEILEGSLNSISDGIDELNSSLGDIASALNAGFSEMILLQGRMADSLEQLVVLVANPSLTWALEQFTLARDEVRRGLFLEAMESIQRAIGGYGSNAGYKTEFRFHGLLGVLQLGEFEDHPLEIVDPKAAEASFLYAAKLCQKDEPIECAKMFRLASRAAYLDKNANLALQHAKNAEIMFRDRVDFANHLQKNAYLEIAYNLCRMAITQAVLDKAAVPQWSIDALKVLFANDLKFSLAAAADPVLCAVPALPASMSETVDAMNSERQLCVEAMDRSHSELSSVLKSKLAKVQNLTKGDDRAPSFDFADEINLAPLPTSVFSKTLSSAFDGKNAFYERMSGYRELVENIQSKINRAIKHEPVLTSGNKMRSADDKWFEGVSKYYIGAVLFFAAIPVIQMIWNEGLGFGSFIMGIIYFVGFSIAFGIFFGIIAFVIGFLGGYVVRSANDDRSVNKTEIDKLRAASQSIASFRNLDLILNNGRLSPNHLKEVMRSANGG